MTVSCANPAGLRSVSNRSLVLHVSNSSRNANLQQQRLAPSGVSRREVLTATVLAISLASNSLPASAAPETSSPAPTITIVSREEGTGTAAAQIGDLVLVHYVGKLEDGTIFDSTRGGLKYRDGGEGAFRPVIIRVGGDPVPGICQGLSQSLLGMKVGGKASVEVPFELGFGNTTVLAPYAVVPPNSTLSYEVELVRLSRRGPDALVQGVVQCGGGFVMERTDGCGNITPAEFI